MASSPTTTAAPGATILLTSHYMADVEALCKRVVVIHHGRMLFDGDLAALGERFAAQRTLVVELDARRRPVARTARSSRPWPTAPW